MTLSYQQEPWFALLLSRTKGMPRNQVAKQLGVSPATLSQVLNGSGLYGEGKASTGRIADKVVHTFGRYICPHLTDESGGEQQEVTAEQCRAFAHSPPPTSSPRAMQHWQACRQCPHREASAPPTERPPVPRKTLRHPATPSTQEETREAL